MCDRDPLISYATIVNNNNSVDDATTDVVPCVQIWALTSCAGTIYPGFGVSNPWSQGDSITKDTVSANYTKFDFTIASLFIPFNFVTVTLTSVAGKTLVLNGPRYLNDVSEWNWSNSTVSLSIDPIHTITFSTIQPWFNLLSQMCMGKQQFFGTSPLTRFNGQEQRCDYFMAQQWCNTRINNTECGCFKDQPGLNTKSQQLGVQLPVICFGENCGQNNTYRTFQMVEQPCNLTVCQQVIKESPGVIDEGSDTVYCGGQFYKQNATPVSPSIVVASSPGSGAEVTPFYVWIMLGISAVIFIVLVIMLFGKQRNKNKTPILQQLQQIKSDRRKFDDLDNTETSDASGFWKEKGNIF